MRSAGLTTVKVGTGGRAVILYSCSRRVLVSSFVRGAPGCPRRFPGTDKLLAKTSWATEMSKSGHKRSLQGDLNCLKSLLNGSIGSCMVGGSKTNLNIESLHDVLVQI